VHVVLDLAGGVLVDVLARGIIGHGTALFADVGPEVHARAVPPDEPGRAFFFLGPDVLDRRGKGLVAWCCLSCSRFASAPLFGRPQGL
jgi:hypothetical protein